MTVDAAFEFAKVYNITRLDVVKGQQFQLVADGPGSYFSDNDPVLDLIVKGNTVDVFAAATGTSTVWIVDQTKQILKELTITVVAEIVPMATKLNLSAE